MSDLAGGAPSAPAAAEPSSTPASEPKAFDSNEPGEGEDFDSFVARQEKTKSKPEKKEPKPEPEAESDGDAEPEEKPQDNPDILKLKVYGKEVEFDISDKERLKVELQRGIAAQQNSEKAAKIQKQAEALVRQLSDNPGAVLEQVMGGDKLRDWAETFLYDKIVQDKMSPEEKAHKAEKSELEQLRAERDKKKTDDEQVEINRLKDTYREDYQRKFVEALETSGVPKNDWSIRRMAEMMKIAIAKGYKDVTPLEVAPMVREQWIKAQKEMLGSLPPEKLIDFLGQDTAEKIREQQLKSASDSSPYRDDYRRVEPSSSGDKASSGRRFTSTADMMRNLKR